MTAAHCCCAIGIDVVSVASVTATQRQHISAVLVTMASISLESAGNGKTDVSKITRQPLNQALPEMSWP